MGKDRAIQRPGRGRHPVKIWPLLRFPTFYV